MINLRPLKVCPEAPGFIKVDTDDSTAFPDISSCKAISVNARASSDFAGYRFSFGNAHAPGGSRYASGYKAHFQPSVGEFVDVPYWRVYVSWGSSGMVRVFRSKAKPGHKHTSGPLTCACAPVLP